MVCMTDLVPEDHILKLIDKAIDWDFIYDLVEDKYSFIGRPAIDPVTLIKIPFIQYLFGIRSMRQTCKEIEVNVAYRWFLGLDMYDKVPHFSTFSKNYTRRFKDTDLFKKIFAYILEECYKAELVNPEQIFIDATHVKARANSKKMKSAIATEESLFYEELLKQEIDDDRLSHGKKKLKDRKNVVQQEVTEFTTDAPKKIKTRKVSTVDEESGWFRKGEHKHVFAYGVQTACDVNGWIVGYTVHPANLHDSRTFIELYNVIKTIPDVNMIVADAGYKTPAIAKTLIDDGIKPVLPYKRPMTKKGFFKKSEYTYDEFNDVYICPNNEILTYSTTNRQGYKIYKSDTTKIVARHVWEEYIEECEDIRHTKGMKEIYGKRKETIERVFGTAKENHGFRYTQMYGKARMEMKAAFTFACMNLKKLAKMKKRLELKS
ncbi:MAG: IS5/IS1182 family transposase, partial [Clostridiales bacterium]